jgi:hypothetical protein
LTERFNFFCSGFSKSHRCRTGCSRSRPRRDWAATLRSWLYRIATNASLRLIEKRSKRVLPIDYGPAADPHEAFGEPLTECPTAHSVFLSLGVPPVQPPSSQPSCYPVSRRTDLWTSHRPWCKSTGPHKPSCGFSAVTPGMTLRQVSPVGRAAPGALPCRLRCLMREAARWSMIAGA